MSKLMERLMILCLVFLVAGYFAQRERLKLIHEHLHTIEQAVGVEDE